MAIERRTDKDLLGLAKIYIDDGAIYSARDCLTELIERREAKIRVEAEKEV